LFSIAAALGTLSHFVAVCAGAAELTTAAVAKVVNRVSVPLLLGVLFCLVFPTFNNAERPVMVRDGTGPCAMRQKAGAANTR
jgi:hypothetical protein